MRSPPHRTICPGTSGKKSRFSPPATTHNSTIHSPCSSSCHAPSVSTLTRFLPANAGPGTISRRSSISSIEGSAIQADLAEEPRRGITAAIISDDFRLGRAPGSQSERMPGKEETHPWEGRERERERAVARARAGVSSLPLPVVTEGVLSSPALDLIDLENSEPINGSSRSFRPALRLLSPFCFFPTALERLS